MNMEELFCALRKIREKASFEEEIFDDLEEWELREIFDTIFRIADEALAWRKEIWWTHEKNRD